VLNGITVRDRQSRSEDSGVTSLGAVGSPGIAVPEPPAPPNLLRAARGVPRGTELEEVEKRPSSHKIAATTWCWPTEGTHGDLDQALAGRIGRWMHHE
jgi:hypothetical protein